jgi:hypothetical protein
MSNDFNIDSIIAEFHQSVKKKELDSYQQFQIDSVNWKLDERNPDPLVRRMYQDNELAQVNKAFAHIEQREKEHKLTDSFRSVAYSQNESQTKGSLTKTLNSHASFISIIQTSN